MNRSKHMRNIFISVLAMGLASLFSSCGEDKGPDIKSKHPSLQGQDELPETSGDPVKIFTSSIDAFNDSNLEDLLESYSADTVWHVPCAPKPPARGRKAVARQLVGFKGMLPDAKIGIRRIIREGEILVAQVVMTATQRWDGQGIERTEPMEVGYEMLYFVQAPSGPAKATLLYFDRAIGRRQLGHMRGQASPVPEKPKGDPEVVSGAGPDREGNVATVEKMYPAWSSGNHEEIAPFLADGFQYLDTSSRKTMDFEGMKAHQLEESKTLSERSYKIREVVSAGSYVAAHWLQQAVYAGAAGKRKIKLHGAHVFTFEQGKIKNVEAYVSEMEAIEQMGLVEQFRVDIGEEATVGKGKALSADGGTPHQSQIRSPPVGP